jgi:hypothetical protein
MNSQLSVISIQQQPGTRVLTCPNCLEEYTLGRTGTVNGCDRCEGITRNADGMIIPDPFVEVFITKEG